MSRPKRFGRDSNLVSDGTIVLCDNSFEKKKGTEKTLWEYDLYKERSSIP